MRKYSLSRRHFRKAASAAASAGLTAFGTSFDLAAALAPEFPGPVSALPQTSPPEYTLRIGASVIEIAPKHFVSTICHNAQFPGPYIALQRKAAGDG